MEKIVKFKSCDGKEFDSEFECLNHERKLDMLEKDIALFTNNLKRISLITLLKELPNLSIIYCKTNESANNLYNEISTFYCTPWDDKNFQTKGCWLYNPSKRIWHEINFEQFKKAINSI